MDGPSEGRRAFFGQSYPQFYPSYFNGLWHQRPLAQRSLAGRPSSGFGWYKFSGVGPQSANELLNIGQYLKQKKEPYNR